MQKNRLIMDKFLICPQCNVEAVVIPLVKMDLCEIICPLCHNILIQKVDGDTDKDVLHS